MHLKTCFHIFLFAAWGLLPAQAEDKSPASAQENPLVTATTQLPAYLYGKDLVETGTYKKVRVQLNEDEFLEIEIPQLAYKTSREAKILETDITTLAQIHTDLREITELPIGEQFQPYTRKQMKRTLEDLRSHIEALKLRIDPFEVLSDPLSDPQGGQPE